jgi:hypothetical protein
MKEQLMSATTTLQKKAKKTDLTAAQVNQIAKMRRGGATWKEVIKAVPATKGWKSNKFAQSLAARGYDRLGRRGGKGNSKARAHGADLLTAKPC